MLYADQLADFTRIQYLFKRNEIRGIPQDVANAYNTVIALGVFQNIRTLFIDWATGFSNNKSYPAAIAFKAGA